MCVRAQIPARSAFALPPKTSRSANNLGTHGVAACGLHSTQGAGWAPPRSAPHALYSALQLGRRGAHGPRRLAAGVGSLDSLVVEELRTLQALIEQPLLGHLLLAQRRLLRLGLRSGLGLGHVIT